MYDLESDQILDESVEEANVEVSMGEHEVAKTDYSWTTMDEINFLNNIPKLYRERTDPDGDNPVDRDIIIGIYLKYRKTMALRKHWKGDDLNIEPDRVKKRLQSLLDNLRKRKYQFIQVRDNVYR